MGYAQIRNINDWIRCSCGRHYQNYFTAIFISSPRLPLKISPFRYLGGTNSLQDVGNTEGVLDGADSTTRGLVEELVDGSDTEAILQHGDSLADGLDNTGLSTLIEEAKAVLGEGETEGILELSRSSSAHCVWKGENRSPVDIPW